MYAVARKKLSTTMLAVIQCKKERSCLYESRQSESSVYCGEVLRVNRMMMTRYFVNAYV